jgi:hypothetical protein
LSNTSSAGKIRASKIGHPSTFNLLHQIPNWQHMHMNCLFMQVYKEGHGHLTGVLSTLKVFWFDIGVANLSPNNQGVVNELQNDKIIAWQSITIYHKLVLNIIS